MNSRLKLLTICFLSIPLSSAIALVPVLSNLASAFPEQRQWIQLLVTIPALFMMFSSLLTDKLSKLSSIKMITVISIAIILFAGVSPYWINHFVYLLFTRALMGIGLGLLNTVIVSLPALYFVDQQERNHAVGMQTAFVCAGGILFNLLSGTVAEYHWQFVFLVQFLNVLPLLIAIFFMPSAESRQETIDASPEHRSCILVKRALPVAALSFICVTLLCTYPLNLSLFIENRNLGTSQFVGLITSINSAIGFAIGLIFGRIYRKTKEKTLLLSLALSAVALLIISFAPNAVFLLLGSMCFGIGTSFVSPALYSILYTRVRQKEVVMSVALMSIAGNVSQFISPFVINPLTKAVSGNTFEGTRFILASILLIILICVLCVYQKSKGSTQHS